GGEERGWRGRGEVRWGDAELATSRRLFARLNNSAPPYFPENDHVAPTSEPVLPFPDASVAVDPEPSSKEYAATSPGEPDAGVVAKAVFEYGPRLPAASVARTRYV